MGITSNDIAAQRAMLERGEEKRKADWKQAERERLRDTFAAAALTGLMQFRIDAATPGAYVKSTAAIAANAYDIADAMLREREQSDRSQPIGSPAKTNPTQPRNDTPAEGSVPGEGSVPDSRNWKEPVAWAVMQNDWYHDAHLDYYKAVKLATAANVAGAKNPWNVVPLYRHPPCQDLSQKNFTLTDAEREAIEIAIRWLEPYPQVAATLRNLLERMK